VLCLVTMAFQRSSNSKSAKRDVWVSFVRRLGNSLVLDADVSNAMQMQGGGRTIKPDEIGEREG